LALLIRTWNVFHGNTKPPQRRAYLEEMVRFVCADEPDVVCLQEVPAWALADLAEWSGMQAFGAIAQPPRLGPVPITAGLGKAITALNNGLFRSAVSGQANAILVPQQAQALGHETLVLNARDFRERQAEWLRLGALARLAWAKERRVVQALRTRFAGGETAVVANLHATAFDADQRLADGELLRAAVFADALAEPGDLCILAGDFNIPAERSSTQAALGSEDWGFSAPLGEGIDQILVRGATVERLERWPRERRVVDGRLLSDHTPVEALVA
jgi:endonuclease/exonuclease/phosphatase family metal-dependent hydrolase